MPVVRVIHWKEAEAMPLLEACRNAGFAVEYLPGDGGAIVRAIRTKPPDAIVLDLSRLPSHSKEVAVYLRNSKTTRSIPLVFVGGEPARVETVRALLPDASYCALSKVAATLKKIMKSGPKPDSAIPVLMMDRYREKPAVEKLGISGGAFVAVVDPPRDFPGLLGKLPQGVDFVEDDAPITLWFVHDREALLDSLRQMRSAASRTKLWLIWKKGKTGEALTQNVLRETTREVGLVDYKICAVNEHWSAMLFARKKA